MNLTTKKYGDAIRILVEEELGIDPPRADFIVLIEKPGFRMKEEIFGHFREHNILEYKNPKDKLDESVVWKATGYAGLYISQRGVKADQTTITIFRASWDRAFYKKLMASGRVEKDVEPGVYILTGYSEIVTRIIITDELEGEEYAAYRALSEKPKEIDLKTLIKDSGEDESTRAYVRVILNLVAEKNPGLIEDLKGRDKEMNEQMKLIFKKELDEKFAEGKILSYYDMVQDGDITIEKAASKVGLTVNEFKEAVKKIQSAAVPA